MSYTDATPVRLVNNFHSISRFGYIGDLLKVDLWNGFSWSARSYVEGVAVNVGIVLGMGILLFFIALFTYFAVCCCRCCRVCKKRESQEAAWNALRCSTIGGVICTLILLAMSIAAAVQTSKIVKETQAGGNTMFDMITAMDDAVFNASDITDQLVNARTQLDNLVLYYPGSTAQIVSARNQINNAISSSPDLGGFPTGDLRNARNDYKKYENRSPEAGLAYFFLPSAWAILVLATLLKPACCVPWFKFLISLAFPIFLLVWLLTALFFFVGIAGSDVCYTPESLLFQNMQCYECSIDPNGGRFTGACTMCYYAVCEAGGSVNRPDYSGELSTAITQLGNAITQFNSLPSPSPAAQPYYNSAKASLQTSMGHMVGLQSFLPCSNFGTYYPSFRDSICRHTVPGIASLYIYHIISGATMFIMLMVMIPVWHNHTSAVKKFPAGIRVFHASNGAAPAEPIATIFPRASSPYQGQPVSGGPGGGNPFLAPQPAAANRTLEMQVYSQPSAPAPQPAYPDISNFQASQPSAPSDMDEAARIKMGGVDPASLPPPPDYAHMPPPPDYLHAK